MKQSDIWWYATLDGRVMIALSELARPSAMMAKGAAATEGAHSMVASARRVGLARHALPPARLDNVLLVEGLRQCTMRMT